MPMLCRLTINIMLAENDSLSKRFVIFSEIDLFNTMQLVFGYCDPGLLGQRVAVPEAQVLLCIVLGAHIYSI